MISPSSFWNLLCDLIYGIPLENFMFNTVLDSTIKAAKSLSCENENDTTRITRQYGIYRVAFFLIVLSYWLILITFSSFYYVFISVLLCTDAVFINFLLRLPIALPCFYYRTYSSLLPLTFVFIIVLSSLCEKRRTLGIEIWIK